jgi:xanthine dehydrogenase YagR molybdenum-binding subunit
VAAVVAAEESVAEDALQLIEVEYEGLPFVHTIRRALEPDAPSLRPDGNVIPSDPRERGSVESGFAEAEVVVEESFSTQVNIHQCLEAHASVADWDADGLTVWASTQGVFTLQATLADLLKLPLPRIRVIKRHMGGGFGSKLYYDISVLDRSIVLAILLSKRTGRPVKFVHDRENESKNTGHRPATLQSFRVGARRDGRLTAVDLTTHITLDDSISRATAAVYSCPNLKLQENTVVASFGAPRPTRAPGNVQNTFALEMTMDRLAERLGMDPLELRRVNYSQTNPADGRPWALKALDECYRMGAERIGWQRRNARAGQAPGVTGEKRRGLGVATGIWGGSFGLPASAIVRLNPDGTVHVLVGTQDIGTGTRTVMSMIAAEELGLSLDDVEITVGDTGVCPPGPLSGGSLTVPSVGPAVRNAAADARERLSALALAMPDSPLAGATTEDLEASEGRIRLHRDPTRSVPFKEVAAAMGRDYIFGTGSRAPNPADVVISTWTAQFADVEVDMETGLVDVKKIVSVHDIGRVLNPLTASSQVEGGVLQGVAYALYEDRIMDRTTGRMANPNLHDYKIPTALEVPEIEAVFVPKPDAKANLIGAKGVGEPPIIPTAAAIGCAVYNATGAFVRDLPMTPDRVLAALEEAGVSTSRRAS